MLKLRADPGGRQMIERRRLGLTPDHRLHLERRHLGPRRRATDGGPGSWRSGYEANFIMQKKGIVERSPTNNEEGKAFCGEHVLIGIPTIMPLSLDDTPHMGTPAVLQQLAHVTRGLRAISAFCGEGVPSL